MKIKKLIPLMLTTILAVVAIAPGALAADPNLTTDAQASINFGAGELRIIEAPSFAMGDHPVPTGPNQVYRMATNGSVTGQLKISDSKRDTLFTVSAEMSNFVEGGGHDFAADLNLEAGTPTVSTSVANYIDNVTTAAATINASTGTQLFGFDSGTLVSDLALTDYMVNWTKPQVTLKITDNDWINVKPSALYESVVTWTISAP